MGTTQQVSRLVCLRSLVVPEQGPGRGVVVVTPTVSGDSRRPHLESLRFEEVRCPSPTPPL